MVRCKAIIVLAVFLLSPSAVTAQEGAVIFGRVVDQGTGEPLRKVRVIIQDAGIQTVTADDGCYRITAVPAGRHTLYVSTVGYRHITRDLDIGARDVQEVLFYLAAETATVTELVHVTAPVFEEVEKAGASQLTLTGTELKNLAGVLVDDPIRSVQTLPGVAAGDDFHSFYSVRGGNYRDNGVVVDGVLTHNLAHTIQGTQEPTGSVTIINGDLVESMALYTGAFSAKYGDRTASFLDVVTREGSRDRLRTRIAVSGSNAAFVAEGPTDATRRGSWIASARKSYIDYLVRRIGPESDLNLGFGDVQAKLSQDVGERHRLGANLIWGRAELSRDPENRGPTSLIDGANNVGIGNFSWAYTPARGVLWENRMYLIRETFLNKNKSRDILGRGEYTQLAVRSDLSLQVHPHHRLEAGTLVRFTDDRIVDRRYDYGRGDFLDYDSARGRFRQTAVYTQDRWTVLDGRLHAILGLRAEKTGLTGQTTVTPRASLEWRLSEREKVDAGWGIFSQFPESLRVLGRNGDPRLRAEVARHFVAGYERLFGSKIRLRFDAYHKGESDLQRADYLYRLQNGTVVRPDVNFHYDNALRGYSRGFEVLLQRRSENRLTGWISYGYLHSRLHDLTTGEWYPGDFEQAHTINGYGSYRLTETWNLSVKARYGSNFPFRGYFEARGSDLYLTSGRNGDTLPYYGRIDFRLNKAFFFRSSRVTLYLEVLNVTNRENIRYDQTWGVNASTKRVSYSRDTLLPILPTAGFAVEF